MSVATANKPKRLIYFIGHPNQERSALICQVCKYYETFSKIFTGEFATRTILNLYNLHAIRGKLNAAGELIADTSMSGPHHYLGFIQPYNSFTIEIHHGDELPTYKEHLYKPIPYSPKLAPAGKIVTIPNFNWINGLKITDDLRSKYNMSVYTPNKLISVSSRRIVEKDSLFDNPGILELHLSKIVFPLITDAYRYDLSSFRAQIVPNNEPFSFNQSLVNIYPHAQHKLRIVTYNYSNRYVSDYLMPGNGIFIERHEFIQAITPTNAGCGGYVILGRINSNGLELIAVTVPFGYTLVVDYGAIHGDSTLTGLYSMAMTGNHKAMATADTVFLKSIQTNRNIEVLVSLPNGEISANAPSTAIATVSPLGKALCLTSDVVPNDILAIKDYVLKQKIKKSLSAFERLYFQPIILTGTSSIGWNKTLGLKLP